MQKYDSNKKKLFLTRKKKKKRRNQFVQYDDSLHTESPTVGRCQFQNLLDLSWLLMRWPKPNEVVLCFWVSVVIVHRKTERFSSKRSFFRKRSDLWIWFWSDWFVGEWDQWHETPFCHIQIQIVNDLWKCPNNVLYSESDSFFLFFFQYNFLRFFAFIFAIHDHHIHQITFFLLLLFYYHYYYFIATERLWGWNLEINKLRKKLKFIVLLSIKI